MLKLLSDWHCVDAAISCDRFGRLAETAAGFGSKVTYAYDSKGRLSRQVVDGSPIDYEYTKYGQLFGKYLGGKLNADASVTYEYSKSGQIVARTANGVRQTYEYDKKGQLLAVKDADGNAVERYAYDKAGNMLKKTLRIGRGDSPSRPQYQTTTFTFDAANQLVSSTTDGATTRYAYDAAGRLVKEGSKIYTYGYLDKVLSVTDGDTKRTFTYHADGQLASANCGTQTETFLWDGLALIQRGDEQFMNEPHVGGGNPVASSKGTSYFNDALGTTVGSKSNGKYSAAALTAFGEGTDADKAFFTGKPMVEGLGHAFLMRNYRAGLAKWQTADPMGYPNGWNALAYCGNGVTSAVDYIGGITIYTTSRTGTASNSVSWRGTLASNVRGFESQVDSFSVSVDYEVVGSFDDGSIDIVFSNIRGSWDISLVFESESKGGMSCSYNFGYWIFATKVTLQAEQLPLLPCIRWWGEEQWYVSRTIRWNIYEYFDIGVAAGLGPFTFPLPLDAEVFKALDAWLDITVVYSEVKE
ncbi:MAG: hypothetical protein IJG18_00145 [Kiritimatiellae bacterium]|nr:hypothetical protein [Kiritimatiellia bacterium]